MLRFARTIIGRTIPNGRTITKKRFITKSKSTLPSVALFKEAESAVNETYESTRKVCLLANTYTKLVPHENNNLVDFSDMLTTLGMSPYDFFRVIYIYLENEWRLNRCVALEFTRKKFDIMYNENRIILHLDDNSEIDIINDIKIGLSVKSNRVYINIKEFNKFNGSSTMYRIVLPHLYKKIQENFFGYNSICNYSTRKLINNIFYNLVHLKYPTLFTVNELDECIIEDFILNSKFYNNDTEINIGQLMDKYAIRSADLFYEMYMEAKPHIEDTTHSYDPNYVFCREEAERVLKSKFNYTNTQYNFIDYHNCKPIQQKFRYGHGDPQTINIAKYENSSPNGAFFKAIFSCMIDVLQNK